MGWSVGLAGGWAVGCAVDMGRGHGLGHGLRAVAGCGVGSGRAGQQAGLCVRLRAWSGPGAWVGQQWALYYGCAAGLRAAGGAMVMAADVAYAGKACAAAMVGGVLCIFLVCLFFPTANGGAMCAMACCVGQRQCPAC